MNAKKLAIELTNDFYKGRTGKVMLDSATMLRQQQSEIEALKEKLTYAKNTIESIVWKDRQPFDESGWASVSFSALAKGADFLRKIQEK